MKKRVTNKKIECNRLIVIREGKSWKRYILPLLSMWVTIIAFLHGLLKFLEDNNQNSFHVVCNEIFPWIRSEGWYSNQDLSFEGYMIGKSGSATTNFLVAANDWNWNVCYINYDPAKFLDSYGIVWTGIITR